MKITRSITPLAVLALAVGLAAVGGAAAAPHSQAWLNIRHQLQGCHSWSLNGGPYAPRQHVAIRLGGSITVTNDDVMPHELVETNGPPVVYTRITAGGFSRLPAPASPAMLARTGASTKITFDRAGLYRFVTKAGDAFMPNIATVGADNLLRLTVRVSS